MNNGLKAAAAVVSLLVTTPIWYWLMYQVLVRVNASELMWFLFWAYVPLHLLAQVVVRLGAEK